MRKLDIVTKRANVVNFYFYLFIYFSISIFMFFNYSLQASVLCIILHWKICIAVCLAHMNGILMIVFKKLSFLFLKVDVHICFGKWQILLINASYINTSKINTMNTTWITLQKKYSRTIYSCLSYIWLSCLVHHIYLVVVFFWNHHVKMVGWQRLSLVSAWHLWEKL